jgi:ATP-dependent DNA helicase RecQ
LHPTAWLRDVRRTAAIGIYSGSAPRRWAGPEWSTYKSQVADDFQNNRLALLVCTKAFGMGVDKPNVRYTIHVGIPGSIEAYAQEAGRAGRDRADAYCFLVASHSRDSEVRTLLDYKTSQDFRRALYRKLQKGLDNDVKRQLHFLYGSFPGELIELQKTQELLTKLLAEEAGDTVAIPMPDDKDTSVEKALFRLSLVGLIQDYTVESGSKSFTVRRAPAIPEVLDRTVLELVGRTEPGKLRWYQQRIQQAPKALLPRALHHVQLVIGAIYNLIEPSRMRALAEIYSLTTGQPSAEQIRTRIVAYLEEGALAEILRRFATADSVEVTDFLKELELTPPTNPYEWISASARQLEGYPDHPLLLVVRAIGESLIESGSEQEFAQNIDVAFSSFPLYQVPDTGAVELFRWIHEQVRTQARSQHWPWLIHLWRSWDRSGGLAQDLAPVERQVLAEAASAGLPAEEIDVILFRRLRQAGALCQQFVAGWRRQDHG